MSILDLDFNKRKLLTEWPGQTCWRWKLNPIFPVSFSSGDVPPTTNMDILLSTLLDWKKVGCYSFNSSFLLTKFNSNLESIEKTPHQEKLMFCCCWWYTMTFLKGFLAFAVKQPAACFMVSIVIRTWYKGNSGSSLREGSEKAVWVWVLHGQINEAGWEKGEGKRLTIKVTLFMSHKSKYNI